MPWSEALDEGEDLSAPGRIRTATCGAKPASAHPSLIFILSVHWSKKAVDRAGVTRDDQRDASPDLVLLAHDQQVDHVRNVRAVHRGALCRLAFTPRPDGAFEHGGVAARRDLDLVDVDVRLAV